MFAAMTEAFCNMFKEQHTEHIKEVARKEVEENNMRLQHCLIETLFESDKMECRQRYSNLRVSGLKLEKEEPIKATVAKFAEKNGVKIKPEEIIETRELRGRNSEKFNPLLVRFANEHTRERFIDAKFAMISKRKGGRTRD